MLYIYIYRFAIIPLGHNRPKEIIRMNDAYTQGFVEKLAEALEQEALIKQAARGDMLFKALQTLGAGTQFSRQLGKSIAATSDKTHLATANLRNQLARSASQAGFKGESASMLGIHRGNPFTSELAEQVRRVPGELRNKRYANLYNDVHRNGGELANRFGSFV